MKKALAMMLALLLSVLAGCGAAGTAPPSPEPTPVPTVPVQEYAESDPITVTVTPVELTEEEQEIADLASRIGDEVHVYNLEADGEIKGRWPRCSALWTEPGSTTQFPWDLTRQRVGFPSCPQVWQTAPL